MEDKEIYLEATKEVEGENRDPALWAKAMALCDGDTGKAKYEYIRCRVESLSEKNKNTENDEQHLRVNEKGKPEISPEENAKKIIPDNIKPSDRNLMRKHGISFDGEMYLYKGHKYLKLDYAIKHAEPIKTSSKQNIYGDKKSLSPTIKSFKIYKHPAQGYEVVKVGFSWPGFFFTWIWAFVKKLWVQGIVLMFAVFIANSLGFAISGGGFAGSLVGLLVSLIPMYITGQNGNEWREKSMLPRGYQLERAVTATTAEGALAKAIKPTEERQEVIGIYSKAEKPFSLYSPSPEFIIIVSILLAFLIYILL